MTDVDEKIWKYLQDIWKPRKLQPSNPFKSMDPQEIQNTQFPSISKRSPNDLQAPNRAVRAAWNSFSRNVSDMAINFGRPGAAWAWP